MIEYKKMIWLIVLIGLSLRLIFLDQSLWLDEAISVLAARDLTFFQILGRFALSDFHPPLHYLVLHFWGKLFGWSEISMRIPSVLFGTATIYVIYLIGKLGVGSWELGDKKKLRSFPLIAALFLATAPFHIYYSQEARMYAMTAFLATLSMYFFMRFLTSNSKLKTQNSELIGYILSTVLMLYSHYFGLFILLTQFLVVLFLFRKKFFSFLALQLFCLVLSLPWLPTIMAQFKHGSQLTQIFPLAKVINVSFIKALPLTFIKFSIGRITIFNKKLYAIVAGILFIIYGGIIGRAISDQWSVIRKKRKPGPGYRSLATIFLWLFIPIFSAWLISLFVPNYQPFRLLLVLPAFYLLLAIGVVSIENIKLKILALFFVLLTSHFSLLTYYTNPYFHREDWRGLVRHIESQGNKDLAAVLPSIISRSPYTYYSQNKVDLIPAARGLKLTEKELNENFEKGLAEKGQIFYIRYLVPLFDPQEKISFWLAENGFVKIREISFNQIPLWVYQKS